MKAWGRRAESSPTFGLRARNVRRPSPGDLRPLPRLTPRQPSYNFYDEADVVNVGLDEPPLDAAGIRRFGAGA
jgi:hypothetical protein